MQIEFAEGTWEILRCCGCEDITFREIWIDSEDYNYNTNEFEPTVQLYPPRGENTLPVKPYYNVSPILRRIYREVIDCYNNEIYTLCAAGLRAIIEGICVDKEIKGGDVEKFDKKSGAKNIIRSNVLEGKIEGMAKAGFLTKKHAEILHEYRFLGNDAVHKLQSPNSEELKLAIEIIEHTLYNLYELPEKAWELKREKKKRLKQGNKLR